MKAPYLNEVDRQLIYSNTYAGSVIMLKFRCIQLAVTIKRKLNRIKCNLNYWFKRRNRIAREDIVSANAIRQVHNLAREIDRLRYSLKKTTEQGVLLRRSLIRLNRKRKKYNISTPITRV